MICSFEEPWANTLHPERFDFDRYFDYILLSGQLAVRNVENKINKTHSSI